MVKIREFTESERLMIYKLRKVENKTLRQIAERFNATAMGILKIVNRIETHGTARNLSRSGRSKCTTDRTNRLINRLVENDRKITAKEIRELIPKKDRKISLRTIQNRIKSNKFYSGFARNRPMISKQNMAKRLAFAKKYQKMPLSFWKRVIWSDESKFELINSKRRVKVWKKRGEKLNKKIINPIVKHSKSVMVWGCMSASGIGHLAEVESKMNAEKYVHILSNHLIQSAEELGIGDDFIFQSDNDPKHTSFKAQAWLRESLIETLEWPPQSPDLNVIEHIWDYLDRNVGISCRKSLPIFKNSLFKVWSEIPQEFIDNLIRSIPNRLQEVIDAKGGNTSF